MYVFLNKTLHRRSYITPLYDTQYLFTCTPFGFSLMSLMNLLKFKQMHFKLTGKKQCDVRWSMCTLAHVIFCVFLSVSVVNGPKNTISWYKCVNEYLQPQEGIPAQICFADCA